MAAFREAKVPERSAATRAWVFAAAMAIGAFDLASYAYFKRESVDFVVARRESEAPLCRLGETMAWQGQAPGALFGWFRPEATGAWSDGRAAAFAARLPGRPAGDLVLTASVSSFVVPVLLPSREVEVLVNRMPVTVWRFDSGQPVERTARIARALIGDDGLVRVEFRFRDSGYQMAPEDGKFAPRMGMKLQAWRLAPA